MLEKSKFLTAALLSLFVLGACGDDDPSDPGDGDGNGNGDGPTEVVFVYDPPAGAPAITSVDVAGTFNNWTIGELEMAEQNDGTWEASIELEPGVYEYKYVFNGTVWPGNMCAGGEWGDPTTGLIDAQTDTCVDDEHGGMNAELVVD